MKKAFIIVALIFISSMLCGQVRLALGESYDSIVLPNLLKGDTISSQRSGEILFSWKNRDMIIHLFIMENNDLYVSFQGRGGYFTYGELSKFEIDSCHIHIETNSKLHGTLRINDFCGTKLTVLSNDADLKEFYYYTVFSDVKFTGFDLMFFKHNLFIVKN